MIIYTNSSGIFGSKILFRLHGSAVFKSCTPAVLSSMIYLVLFRFTNLNDDVLMDNPYPIGALVTAFSFLLIFRANFSYNRYWEAHTAIHAMHSKWLDMATELAALHLQSACYDAVKPPSFGKYAQSRFSSTSAKRQQHDPLTQQQLEQQIDTVIEKDPQLQASLRSRFQRSSNNPVSRRWFGKSQKAMPAETDKNAVPPRKQRQSVPGKTVHFNSNTQRYPRHASDFLHMQDGTPYTIFWRHAKERLQEGHITDEVPVPYFLETAAHLLSLMSAVAFSTLRNDMEEAESPLAEFRPNAPWPHVDPDSYQRKIRKGWYLSEHRSYTIMRYLLGLTRTEKARMLYNKGRPFRVIGDVSDAEIQAIQLARGPQAKVTLVSFWLQELISREYLTGSTGAVAPPIISRLYHFISEGMSGYNQARKIAYIPFPFPHAQITTLFVLVILGCIPVLMLTYLDNGVFGFFWNWLTVMCFTGLHEVARELENPFINVPNEIPLNHFQAQFNEGLMTMFFGYHPDAYWLPNDDKGDDQSNSNTTATKNSAAASGSDEGGNKAISFTDSSKSQDATAAVKDDGSFGPSASIPKPKGPVRGSSIGDTMLLSARRRAPSTDSAAGILEQLQAMSTISELGSNDNKDFGRFIINLDDDGSDGSVVYAPTFGGKYEI